MTSKVECDESKLKEEFMNPPMKSTYSKFLGDLVET